MSIDRYDPIRIIGEGSFGKVYLMRDKVKRNFVCIKIIKIKNIPKKEREATKAEVDLLKRLHHPNIVRYLDSFLSKNGESLCICMEYCDGGDLASQIKAARRNLFSESKILHWFVQLALGLHYMHSNKVLHRDLKTQNVFLLGNGRLVLGDLGISKVLDGTMDFAQTCIGTPYYMSPEIFKNKPYSYKSDVWALGCVLYEMTTLNHAFDANSLNGLATKIIKGKYPPIHAKYSKFLRELIGQMLLLDPKQRPDVDQILRKPFIKKHIVNFFTDIASRPTNSIGEGTMIVKAAAGGLVNGAVGSDTNMISLRKQLHALEMTTAVQDALAPKPALAEVDDQMALKLAKEQASALKREQEHKKMVEAALEKLRVERENRLKEKAIQVAGGGRYPPPIQKTPVAVTPSNIAMGGNPPNNKAPSATPRNAAQQQNTPSQIPSRRPSNANALDAPMEAARKEYAVRDRGMNWNKKESDDNSSVASNQPARNEGALRRRSFGEDKDKLKEKERQMAEERRQAEEVVKRREDVRLEARAREEARLREEGIRQREEALAKQRQEQLRVQAEAASRRDKLREKERERQREEIEQLKRDKLELDRRSEERDKVREQRRAVERQRLEGVNNMAVGRKDLIDAAQEKLSRMNDEISSMGSDKQQQRNSARGMGGIVVPIDDSKNGADSYLSARDRVFLRKQEKLAKDEAQRLEALREAEAENQKIRVEAQKQYRNIYDNASSVIPKNNARALPQHQSHQYLPSHLDANEAPPRYEFDPSGRDKVRRDAMDFEELNDRLNEAVKGKSRYDAEQHQDRPSNLIIADHDSEDEEDADDLWQLNRKKGNVMRTEDDNHEEEEDLYRKEEELRAELNFSTVRVQELKKTLKETKSFMGQRGLGMSSRGNGGTLESQLQHAASSRPTKPDTHYARAAAPSGIGIVAQRMYDEEDEDEDDDDDDGYDLSDQEEEEDSNEQSSTAVNSVSPSPKVINSKKYGLESARGAAADSTIRIYHAPGMGGDRSSFSNLQDPPSPSGRLGDRIERLRHRCVEALGREAFNEAYAFLKQQDDDSQSYDHGNDDNYDQKKMQKIRSILGEGKAVYGGLIEQLIFMEETHGG